MYRKIVTTALLLSLLLAVTFGGAQGPAIAQKHEYYHALDLAAQQERTVLAYFWRENCYYCERMNSAVFPNPEVLRLLESHYVVASIDTRSEAGRKLAQGYRVTGTPAFIFVREHEGTWYEMNRFVGGRSAERFTATLQSVWQQSF